jgi:hypothetical protein
VFRDVRLSGSRARWVENKREEEQKCPEGARGYLGRINRCSFLERNVSGCRHSIDYVVECQQDLFFGVVFEIRVDRRGKGARMELVCA